MVYSEDNRGYTRPLPERSLFFLNSIGEVAEEPYSDDYSWVTVEFLPSMKYTHTDEMLLKFAICEIENCRAKIYRSPQHWERYHCISFPVWDTPEGTNVSLEEATRTIMIQAVCDAKYWLNEVYNRTATLRKGRIFEILVDRRER